MIKLLVQLVIPPKLGFLAEAFAIATTAFSVISNIERSKDIREAQKEQRATEGAIRKEQEGRERRKQTRQANILTAQAEARQFATEGGEGASSGITGVRSAVSANLSRNVLEMRAGLEGSAAVTAAREGVTSAAHPSNLDILNRQLQPLIFSAISGK